MAAFVKVLGTPGISYRDRSIELVPGKTSGLLYYLAYQQGWVPREDLHYLLWPDKGQKNAQDSLRTLLSTIRGRPYAANLSAERTRLRWDVDTDVKAFRDRVASGAWPQATERYQGEFLHGFKAHRLPELESWIEGERQELHALWRDAALQVCVRLEQSRQHRQAAELLRRLHHADPDDEAVLRRLMAALYRGGDRHQALTVFADFERSLRDELGGEPEGETHRLAGRIRERQQLEQPSSVNIPSSRPRSPMPAPTTPFIGRASEIETLTTRLADPDCRLLTVAAPGGMGKTRLAIEVGRSLDVDFRDGARFVPLADVMTVEAMVTAVAGTLDLRLFGSSDPRDQLLNHLRDKAHLLILDNLEHLLDGVDLIADILEASPDTKVLATSRGRLTMRAETVIDLLGLSVPAEGMDLDPGASDALRLFEAVARRVRSDFAWDEVSLAAATQAVRLVEGMPLAIELAASWLRILTPDQIVGELDHALDFLETDDRDVPQRHRRIRAVLEGSWERLGEGEKAALRRLSVFHGGFTGEAAREVAGVGLPQLLALVNRALLRREVTGRFLGHPFLWQFLRERAETYPEKRERTEERARQLLRRLPPWAEGR